MVGKCSVDGCERFEKLERGWCFKHYKRWQVHGTPHGPAPIRHSFSEPEKLKEYMNENRRITEIGCWEWTRANTAGYGVIVIESKQQRLHRISACLYLGMAIDSELKVCHVCDNPPCFNPEHLFLGTVADNNRDKISKGRANVPFGDGHHTAKLNSHQVRRIRLMLELGESQRMISGLFGVTQTAISAIRNGRIWGHLEPLS